MNKKIIEDDKINNNKQTITLLIAAVIILAASISALTVSAGGTATVSLADFDVNQSSTIKAPLMLYDVTDVVGGELNVSFDPSVVHVTGVSDGEIGTATHNINNESGWVYMNVFGSEGKSGDVVFAYLNLTAVGCERDHSPLNISVISLFDTNYMEIPYNTDSGTFTIKDITPPASISNLTNATGNFWINWTWDLPTDADFNHTMVYIDAMLETNTSDYYFNATYAPHATKTISTHTVDSSGNINLSGVNQTTIIPNNAPMLETIGDKTIYETETLTIDANATDLDIDTLTYSCNRTDLFSDFSTTTGIGSWTASIGQAGTYYVDFGVADAFDGMDNETIRITVKEVATVSLADFESYPGSTSKAPIMIYNVTAIVSGELNISFDPSVVHVTDVSDGEIGTTTAKINNETGWAYMNVFGIKGKSGDVVFAYLNLTAVGCERDNSPLNISVISLFDINYTDVTYNTDNGTFTIKDTPPASISNLTNATGNFWINWTWDLPTDADFNHTMVYIDAMFETNTSDYYFNATYAPHATKTISTHTVDSSGNINLSCVNQTTIIPNNAPVLETIGDKTIYETETLTIDANATDLDVDTLTYSCNHTGLFSDFNTTTGIGSWTASLGQAGTYYLDFGVADGFDGMDNETIKITVNEDTTPPVITNSSATPSTILNDNGRPRPPGTNITELKVTVTDDAGVQSVTINLSSIGGSADQQMNPVGCNLYSVTTNATAGINFTHNLNVTATDTSGNNNTTVIKLTVLRRGDIFRDNSTDLKDAMYIAKYLAGLEPERSNPPSVLVGDVVGLGGDPAGDGLVDMKDSVYITRWRAGLENEP